MRLVRYGGSPGELDGRAVAPGWPRDDTAGALAFTAAGAWSWLILDDDERIAGECGAKGPPDSEGRVEIGYGLAAGSRGRGLGTRAVAALLEELAAAGGVSDVTARVHLGNEASRRLLLRLGFAVAQVEVEQAEITYVRAVASRRPS